jgi:hypothetical protein
MLEEPRHKDLDIQSVIISLNLGFSVVVAAQGSSFDPFTRRLYEVNSWIRMIMHLRQTDVATQGFAFFLFGSMIFAISWVLLWRLTRSFQIGKWYYVVGGAACMCMLPVIWVFGNRAWNGGWKSLEVLQIAEVTLILISVILFLYGKAAVSLWVAIAVVAIHFAFWLRQFGLFDGIENGFRLRRFDSSNLWVPSGVPFTALIGLLSSGVWVFFVSRIRRSGSE